MPPSKYELMQKAVDIVRSSPHLTSKVAATLYGIDSSGQEFTISQTNYWPKILENIFGQEQKIGDASATMHAETACLIFAPATNGASMFVTDLPCPNCVKNMAEAGVKNLYIDHKGYDKDFSIRRGHHFKNMSMRICENAGINIFTIFRKEKRIERISEIQPDDSPTIENPAHIESMSDNIEIINSLFLDYVEAKSAQYGKTPFAVAAAYKESGKLHFVSAQAYQSIGHSPGIIEKYEGKYSFTMQPLNRIFMNASRYGLTIDKNYIFSSRVPTSREFVNMAGAGVNEIMIGDLSDSYDQHGPKALEQLQSNKIISIKELIPAGI